MTWVKICGMTNLEDALVAVEAGADAVGFVFYEKSPRYVTVETAREIVEKLPKNVEKVGVFAGECLARAVDIGACVDFDSLQVYPLSAPKSVASAESTALPKQRRLYFALPMRKFMSDDCAHTLDVTKSPEGSFVAMLLDSGDTERPGGTGLTFDWNKAAPIVASLSRTQHVVIAGGLTPQNVGEAIGILSPWGVDVAYGVEASPGKKDPEKVRAFVRAVREMDRRAG
jgi:phosphoribosylanthranilate isomerase